MQGSLWWTKELHEVFFFLQQLWAVVGAVPAFFVQREECRWPLLQSAPSKRLDIAV